MIKPRITKKDLKHHFNYMGWMYLLIPVIMVFSWSLIFSVTEYQPPDDKILSFYMVGQYVNYDAVEAIKEEVTPDFPEMEELDFMAISVENAYDAANWQRFFTYVYAQQGDVMLLDREIFDAFCAEGMFLPLDGFKAPESVDLSLTTATTTDLPDEPHVYGIPADELYGLWMIDQYDMRRSVFVVMAYSDNLEEGTQLIEWFFETRAAPQPDGFDHWEKKSDFYPEDGTIDMDYLNMW